MSICPPSSGEGEMLIRVAQARGVDDLEVSRAQQISIRGQSRSQSEGAADLSQRAQQISVRGSSRSQSEEAVDLNQRKL